LDLIRNTREFSLIDKHGVHAYGTKLHNIHYAAIKHYGRNYLGGNYLEIGTRYGHSALQAWSAMRPKRMFLCDIYPEKRQLTFVERYLVCVGCDSEVTFVEGNSLSMVPRIKQKFDLILVDGGHSNHEARKDLENSWKILAPGGTLLFDDTKIKRLENEVTLFAKSLKDIKNFEVCNQWQEGVAVLEKEG
jgi:predicted O-methyltransferase YrrM